MTETNRYYLSTQKAMFINGFEDYTKSAILEFEQTFCALFNDPYSCIIYSVLEVAHTERTRKFDDCISYPCNVAVIGSLNVAMLEPSTEISA